MIGTWVEIISTFVAVAMLLLIWLQLRLQTKQSRFEALSEVHKEVFRPEFREALLAIFSSDPDDLAVVKSRDLLEKLGIVTGLYDLVGVRLEEGILPSESTLKTEWKILLQLWNQVEKYVNEERKRRKLPDYKKHLQDLVDKAKKYRDDNFPGCCPEVIDRSFLLRRSDSERYTLIRKN